MALINQADVQARLGRTLTSEEATAFAVINPAVQAYVERLINSSVEAAEPSTRLYDGGVVNLKIDPCTDVTDVKYVDNELASEYTFLDSEYTLEPVNKTLKTMLRNRFTRFARGFNNVQVTAKFSIAGDAEVLAIVKNALIDFLVSEVQNSDNVKKESIEGYSIEYASTESRAALAPIKFLFPEV